MSDMRALDIAAACRFHGLEKARLEETRREMEMAMTSLAISVDQQPSGGGGDRMAAYAARVGDVDARIQAAGKMLAAEAPAVILLTEALPAVQRRSLRRFYVDLMGVSQIAREMDYTPSSIYKALHAGRDALRAMSGERVDEKLPAWYVRQWAEGEK